MKILKKSFLSYEKSLITRSSRAPFLNFFEKKETYLDPNRKKIRKSKLSDYLVPGLVVLSWVFIFKIWWGAEEVCRKQYESLAKEDASAYRTVFENKELRKNEIPEEYRSEYIEKQKRRMTALIKQRKEAENLISQQNIKDT